MVTRGTPYQGIENQVGILEHGKDAELGIWTPGLEFRKCIDAGGAGQVNVEENGVGLELGQPLKGFLRGATGRHAFHAVGLTEESDQRFLDFAVVFHDGHSDGHIHLTLGKRAEAVSTHEDVTRRITRVAGSWHSHHYGNGANALVRVGDCLPRRTVVSHQVKSLALVSLVLNLVLATIVFRGEGEALPRAESASASIRNTAAVLQADQRPKPAFLRERAIMQPHWPRWGDIASGDWAVFRDNLRALGCPEEVVQAILAAEVQAWAEVEFARQPRDAQYGVNGSRFMGYLRDLRDSRRRMELEERAILEQLLGVSWNQLTTYTLSSLRGAWGNKLLHFLPDNRLDAVHAAYLKVEDLHEYYEPRVTRWMSERELDEVRSAVSAALAEFRVLLSPAELEEVELRLWVSRAARNGEMKGELQGRRSGMELREWFRAERARQLQSNLGVDDFLESHFLP